MPDFIKLGTEWFSKLISWLAEPFCLETLMSSLCCDLLLMRSGHVCTSAFHLTKLTRGLYAHASINSCHAVSCMAFAYMTLACQKRLLQNEVPLLLQGN